MTIPITFFGDGSASLHPSFSRVLQTRKDGSLLAQFLEESRLALQQEIYQIPLPERKGLPDLAELEILIRAPEPGQLDNQCIAPAMLIMIQLGQFIDWYESRPTVPYPECTKAITVGLCLGQLSAVAVCQARSLLELLPLAAASVRIAFRTGLLATTVRDDLERPANTNAAWAITASRELDLSDADTLSRVQDEMNITERKRAYISASFPKATTIQGPPSTLERVDALLQKSRDPSSKVMHKTLPIFSLYHSAHLYSDEDIRWILSSAKLHHVSDESTWVGPGPRLVSPVTGAYYEPSSNHELIHNVLHDLLREPIRWENVTAGSVQYVTASQASSCCIQSFGPGPASQSLASALKANTSAEILLENALSSLDPPLSAAVRKEPLAIVGMAGRFPDAMNHNELWKLLEQGVDCAKVIPGDRFDPALYVPKDGEAKNATGTEFGCFMKDPGNFDARFFNMSPREAEQTDPQQRLILATAHEALEMSGFVPNRTPSTQLERIGTYYGQTADDYREMNASQDIQTYYVTGNDRAFGPGRINYHFKFGGPSVDVDTACSSSAIALNIACTALWADECATAVVGGMLLMTSPDSFCGLTRAHFANSTGNCKTYDDGADGYCRGEAIGTIIVKRLSDAQADNDNILATILAAGTNHSAYAVSLTHPHGPTQEKLYHRLLHHAGLHPFDVDYVEMHGTGTQAGDATEMSSVSNVFAPESPSRPANRPLWVGAVKANLGHGESASGITALIKTLLMFREQKIPPHIGIKSGVLNHTFPDLKKRNINIALNGAVDFPYVQDRKRRALVNNFGAAGGNTAFLIEDAPRRDIEGHDARSHHIVSVTAKSTASMKMNLQNLITYLEDERDLSLSDLSYSTTARRMQFPMRTSIVASDLTELKTGLAKALDNASFKPASNVSNVILAFTGQGSLYTSMAQDLFQYSQQFRSDILRFDRLGREHGFPSFVPVIDGSESDLNVFTPSQTQLALTAVQMSLARLWAAWGITPTAVIGHSLGEYAALYACGVLSASDTLALVGQRAQLLEKECTQGTHCMLSVRSSQDGLEKALQGRLGEFEVACINGPEDIVLSGPAQPVHDAHEQLKSAGIRCTILNTPFAFHSSQIDPILDEFEVMARSVTFAQPTVPLLSPLLGEVVKDDGVIGPSYLRRHARGTVDFHKALQTAEASKLAGKAAVWLELGPNPVCVGMLRSTFGPDVRAICSLRKNERAWTSCSQTVSYLHMQGLKIEWNEYHRDFESSQTLLNLPTYAFDEKRYWIDYKGDWALRKGDETAGRGRTADVKSPISSAVQRLISKRVEGRQATFVFETDLSEPQIHAAIAGHIINGLALCPAGVYADMAMTIADYVRQDCEINVPTTGIDVTEMEVLAPITVPLPRIATPQLLRIMAVAGLEDGKIRLEYGLHSPETGKTGANAKCQVEFGDDRTWLHEWSRSTYLVQKRIEDLARGVNEGRTAKMFSKMVYKLFSALVDYGPKYRGMQEVLVDSDEIEATATLQLYQGEDIGKFFANPLWLDNLAQVAGFMMNSVGIIDLNNEAYIAHGWRSCRIALPIDHSRPLQVHVKMQPLDKSTMAGNVSVLQDGSIMGVVGDLKFQRTPRSLLNRMLPPSSGAASQQSKNRQPPAKATPSATDASTPAKPSAKTAKAKSPPRKQESSSQGQSSVSQVLALLATEVGFSVEDMTDETGLSELGIDSLMSLTILSRIRETVGIDISQAAFQDLGTVGDLKAYIKANASEADDDNDDDDSVPDMTDSSDRAGTSDSDSEYIVMTPSEDAHEAKTSTGPTTDDVYDIVSELTGVGTEDLVQMDDLSECGVDSLMSLNILAALREKLGVDIPSHEMEGKFSLSALKKVLDLQPAEAQVDHAQTAPQPKQSPSPQLKPNIMLLQGNPKTATQKIFLFPDGSGSATAYSSLPDIKSGTCVFAIDSPFLKSPEKYTCSLEEIAQMMVEGVRARQPKGPYVLSGWSAGGMYAYEAAKALIASGETVSKLILIDSPCRLRYGPIPQDVLDYVSTSGVVGNAAGSRAPAWLVRHFRGTIRAVGEYAPVPFDPATAPATFLIWAKNGLFDDRPEAREADLDLSDAAAKWFLESKDTHDGQGWDELLPAEKVWNLAVDGNHFSMVHPPNCTSLSKAIADALEDNAERRVQPWTRK